MSFKQYLSKSLPTPTADSTDKDFGKEPGWVSKLMKGIGVPSIKPPETMRPVKPRFMLNHNHKEITNPGSRGSTHWYRTKQGQVRYGDRPQPAAPKDTSTRKDMYDNHKKYIEENFGFLYGANWYNTVRQIMGSKSGAVGDFIRKVQKDVVPADDYIMVEQLIRELLDEHPPEKKKYKFTFIPKEEESTIEGQVEEQSKLIGVIGPDGKWTQQELKLPTKLDYEDEDSVRRAWASITLLNGMWQGETKDSPESELYTMYNNSTNENNLAESLLPLFTDYLRQYGASDVKEFIKKTIVTGVNIATTISDNIYYKKRMDQYGQPVNEGALKALEPARDLGYSEIRDMSYQTGQELPQRAKAISHTVKQIQELHAAIPGLTELVKSKGLILQLQDIVDNGVASGQYTGSDRADREHGILALDQQYESTLPHEMGHFIDNVLAGPDTSHTWSTETTSGLNALVNDIKKTEAHKNFINYIKEQGGKTHQGNYTLKYYTNEQEIFARFFAAEVLHRTNRDTEQRADLEHYTPEDLDTLWPELEKILKDASLIKSMLAFGIEPLWIQNMFKAIKTVKIPGIKKPTMHYHSPGQEKEPDQTTIGSEGGKYYTDKYGKKHYGPYGVQPAPHLKVAATEQPYLHEHPGVPPPPPPPKPKTVAEDTKQFVSDYLKSSSGGENEFKKFVYDHQDEIAEASLNLNLYNMAEGIADEFGAQGVDNYNDPIFISDSLYMLLPVSIRNQMKDKKRFNQDTSAIDLFKTISMAQNFNISSLTETIDRNPGSEESVIRSIANGMLKGAESNLGRALRPEEKEKLQKQYQEYISKKVANTRDMHKQAKVFTQDINIDSIPGGIPASSPAGTGKDVEDLIRSEHPDWDREDWKKFVARSIGNRLIKMNVTPEMCEDFYNQTGQTARSNSSDPRISVADTLVHAWAQSADGSVALSIAVQRLTPEVFPGASRWDTINPWNEQPAWDRASEWMQNPVFKHVVTAFLQAQYQNTQDYFSRLGVKELTIGRGCKTTYEPIADAATKASEETKGWGGEKWVTSGEITEKNYVTNPLSSWGWDSGTNTNFSGGGGLPSSDQPGQSIVLGMRVPVSRILGGFFSGDGCENEHEVILIGSEKAGDKIRWAAWQDNTVAGAKTRVKIGDQLLKGNLPTTRSMKFVTPEQEFQSILKPIMMRQGVKEGWSKLTGDELLKKLRDMPGVKAGKTGITLASGVKVSNAKLTEAFGKLHSEGFGNSYQETVDKQIANSEKTFKQFYKHDEQEYPGKFANYTAKYLIENSVTDGYILPEDAKAAAQYFADQIKAKVEQSTKPSMGAVEQKANAILDPEKMFSKWIGQDADAVKYKVQGLASNISLVVADQLGLDVDADYDAKAVEEVDNKVQAFVKQKWDEYNAPTQKTNTGEGNINVENLQGIIQNRLSAWYEDITKVDDLSELIDKFTSNFTGTDYKAMGITVPYAHAHEDELKNTIKQTLVKIKGEKQAKLAKLTPEYIEQKAQEYITNNPEIFSGIEKKYVDYIDAAEQLSYSLMFEAGLDPDSDPSHLEINKKVRAWFLKKWQSEKTATKSFADFYNLQKAVKLATPNPLNVQYNKTMIAGKGLKLKIPTVKSPLHALGPDKGQNEATIGSEGGKYYLDKHGKKHYGPYGPQPVPQAPAASEPTPSLSDITKTWLDKNIKTDFDNTGKNKMKLAGEIVKHYSKEILEANKKSPTGIKEFLTPVHEAMGKYSPGLADLEGYTTGSLYDLFPDEWDKLQEENKIRRIIVESKERIFNELLSTAHKTIKDLKPGNEDSLAASMLLRAKVELPKGALSDTRELEVYEDFKNYIKKRMQDYQEMVSSNVPKVFIHNIQIENMPISLPPKDKAEAIKTGTDVENKIRSEHPGFQREDWKKMVARDIGNRIIKMGISEEMCREFYNTTKLTPRSDSSDLRISIADSCVAAWASSADGDNALSLAIQRLTPQVFPGASRWDTRQPWNGESAWDWSTKYIQNPVFTQVVTAFLHAQYQNTQDYFSRLGVTELTIGRGCKTTHSDITLKAEKASSSNSKWVTSGELDENHYVTNPLSSWGWDSEVNTRFAGGGGLPSSDQPGQPIVIAARVPVSRIIGGFFSGAGCEDEHEVIMIGSDKPVDKLRWAAWNDTDYDTEEQTRITIANNLLAGEMPNSVSMGFMLPTQEFSEMLKPVLTKLGDSEGIDKLIPKDLLDKLKTELGVDSFNPLTLPSGASIGSTSVMTVAKNLMKEGYGLGYKKLIDKRLEPVKDLYIKFYKDEEENFKQYSGDYFIQTLVQNKLIDPSHVDAAIEYFTQSVAKLAGTPEAESESKHTALGKLNEETQKGVKEFAEYAYETNKNKYKNIDEQQLSKIAGQSASSLMVTLGMGMASTTSAKHKAIKAALTEELTNYWGSDHVIPKGKVSIKVIEDTVNDNMMYLEDELADGTPKYLESMAHDIAQNMFYDSVIDLDQMSDIEPVIQQILTKKAWQAKKAKAEVEDTPKKSKPLVAPAAVKEWVEKYGKVYLTHPDINTATTKNLNKYGEEVAQTIINNENLSPELAEQVMKMAPTIFTDLILDNLNNEDTLKLVAPDLW